MYLEDYFTSTPVKHLISMVLCQGKISVWLSYIQVDQLPAFSKENVALQHPSSVTCKQLEQTGPKAMVFYQVRLLRLWEALHLGAGVVFEAVVPGSILESVTLQM